jgi:DNA modification methylase
MRVSRTTIIHADVMQGLRLLPDESVHMVMTSPPYWGQRDYSVAPSVWGGDPKHNHRGLWRPAGTRHRGGPAGKSHQRAGRDNTQRDAVGDIRLGEYCMCGAWRGQLGLEPTIGLYVEHVVDVFREVRRVLRKDGTFWLNIGDTYNSNTGQQNLRQSIANTRGGAIKVGTPEYRLRRPNAGNVKGKELCLIPEKLIVALQESGWWIRRDIIWAKDTCMPESCRDRPTTAHEYLWLLTKRPKYFYDALAIAEPSSPDTHARMKRARTEAFHAPGQDPHRGVMGVRTNTNGVNRKIRVPTGWDQSEGHHHGKQGRYGTKQNESFSAAISPDLVPLRNKRSVWTINPEPFAEAHFATFPTKLVEPCILAGTSEKGCCPHCYAPHVRLVKVKYHTNRERGEWAKRGQDKRGMARSEAMYEYGAAVREEQTLGWHPSCTCEGEWYKASFIDVDKKRKTIRKWRATKEVSAPVAATALDPFGGAGTVGLVASRLQRHTILIEIKPEYVEMARRRITADAPLLADIQILKPKGVISHGKEVQRQEAETEAGTGSRVLSTEGAPAGASV